MSKTFADFKPISDPNDLDNIKVVGWDTVNYEEVQFDASLNAAIGPKGDPGLVWKGEWDTSTEYNEDDAVEYEGSSYRATGTSIGAQPDLLGSWELLAAKGEDGNDGPQGEKGLNWLGNWNSTTPYVVGDAVENGGSSYVCISSHSNEEPPNITYWELLAAKGDDADPGLLVVDTVFPIGGDGSGLDPVTINKYALAFAQEVIEDPDVVVVPGNAQYLIADSLTIESGASIDVTAPNSSIKIVASGNIPSIIETSTTTTGSSILGIFSTNTNSIKTISGTATAYSSTYLIVSNLTLTMRNISGTVTANIDRIDTTTLGASDFVGTYSPNVSGTDVELLVESDEAIGIKWNFKYISQEIL